MKNPDFRIPSPCLPVISRRDFGLAVSSAVLANRATLGAPEWRVKRVGSTAQRLREKPYEKRLTPYPEPFTPTLHGLATRSSLGGERPLNRFDPDAEYDSGQPTVTMNQLGKGKAIYISADVGSGYLHNPYPVLKRFVADLAARARLPLELEAPRAIEVTAFLPKSDQLHVHLLNNPTPNLPLSLTREQLRSFFYLEEVLPVHDVRIRFNDFKPRSARMPIGGQTLEVQGNSVRVPRVDLHEVIVLEV